MIEKIQQSVDFIKSQGIINPEIGIILGTGLGSLVKHIDIEVSIDYTNIPNFPEATVEFHSGKLIYGHLEGKRVLVMSGRFHYYEGYSLEEVTFPVRVMKMLGIETLLLSNACGGINPDYKPASLMLIDYHINKENYDMMITEEVCVSCR